MKGGTLVVSKAVKLHEFYKRQCEQFGFVNVTVTAVEKDGLNTIINDLNPYLLIMDSAFYQAGTPYMIGVLHQLFPKLTMAVVSLTDYPLSLAPWFIWHGAKSYLSLWDGLDEFIRGIKLVQKGEQYISPLVKTIIESYHEWPDTKTKITKRQQECLIMLCNGMSPEQIGNELHITRATVHNHLGFLYNTFHVTTREEMVALAWELELVTKNDMRFRGRETKNFSLPEWAAVKLKNEQIIKRISVC